MNYRKLELIFLVAGITAVLISIIAALAQNAPVSEVTAQALFIPVLFVSLHYGRQPGFTAAVLSALVYLIAKAQEGGALDLTSVDGRYTIVRACLFGLIGIFGSELAVRAKYLIARLRGGREIENRMQLYNKSYLQKTIASLFEDFDRQNRSFSIVFITLDWRKPVDQKQKDKIILETANIIRSNIRLVDELGYPHENCFCLILPDTAAAAAKLVFERLQSLSRVKNDCLVFFPRILTMPENKAEIKSMLPVETKTELAQTAIQL